MVDRALQGDRKLQDGVIQPALGPGGLDRRQRIGLRLRFRQGGMREEPPHIVGDKAASRLRPIAPIDPQGEGTPGREEARAEMSLDPPQDRL